MYRVNIAINNMNRIINYLKNISFIAILVACFIFSQASKVNAAGSASLSFSPSNAEVKAGKDLTINVHLSTGGEAVNAVQADVYYPTNLFDPAKSKARCVNEFPTQAQSSVKAGNNNKGLIKLACAVAIQDSGAQPFTGEADMGTITLHSRSNAPSIYSAKMLDFAMDNDTSDGTNKYSAVARASDSVNILNNTHPAAITVISGPYNKFSNLDINNDKTIDNNDLTILISNFGLRDSKINNLKTDINNDHVVNSIDLSILLSN
jgi:hypothetical protein